MFRIVIIAALLFSTACEGFVSYDDPATTFGEEGTDATGAPVGSGASVASALSGPELYQQNCAGCHGATAEGSAIFEASIQGYAPIEPIVVGGRGGMPPMALPSDDIQKIQTYISSLAAPAEELDGQGLFNRYCASCHGADAAGAESWPGSIQGYEPIADIVQSGRGEMAPIPITTEQTQLIQDWLLTLAPSLSSLNGVEVYNRLCVTCHGDRGEGTATKGLQLRYDDDAFTEYWTRTGRQTQTFDGDMPAFPATMVSDQQLDEMLDWLNGAPHPTDGEGLYVQYCANCHGADGRGGPTGKSIRGEGEGREKIREGEGADYGNRQRYMTGWGQAQLTDAEVDLILEYVQTL